MIRIENLKVKYSNKTVLNIDTPLRFNSNDRIGIIGSNGAGKSTMVNALLDLIPYEGRYDLGVAKEDIGVHMQFNEYQDAVSIKTIIEMVLNCKIERNKKLKELIEFFDFEQSLKKKFSQLSGGQKQRLTLILVLAKDSKMVFFDEVTSGLDFQTRERLMDLLSKWYEDKDTGIIIISHYYQELENIINKLIILDDGEIVDWGDVKELFQKYCGHSLFIVESEKIEEFNSFDTKKREGKKFIIRPRNHREEEEILKKLYQLDADYRRTKRDIEILTEIALEEKKRRKNDYAE
ncbi:MAG: ABC transporter ATP-binding protein [Andreesenia angusta]|nr:ABC transporter ATP-binding protein [Andreesenia angusta]